MKHLSKYNIFNKLKQSMLTSFTPKWIIFTIDICINSVLFLLFFSFWRFISTTHDPKMEDFFIFWGLFVGTTMLTSLLFKTYNSVMRYHGLKDTITLLCMTGTSFMMLFLILKLLNILPYLDSTLLLLIFGWESASFFILFTFRIAVGFIYFIWTGQKNVRTKHAAIFGVGPANVGAISVLKNSSNGVFTPTVLFSTNNNIDNKKIEGIPIVGITNENIESIILKYKIKAVIFFSAQLESINREYTDILLKNNIELVMMNLINPFSDKSGLSGTLQKIEIEDLLGRRVIDIDNKIVKERLNNQTILVTGGAGSIGSEIVRQVCAYKCNRIIIFDIAETPLNSIWLEIKNTFKDIDIIPIIGDIQDREHLEIVFSTYRPIITYHAAAYKHVPMMEMHPMKAMGVNVLGSKNVADMALKHNSHMVMISTDKAVNPTNVMGASKRIAELYVQSLFYHKKEEVKNIPNSKYPRLVITRFGNVLGSNGSVVPLFKEQIKKGGPVTITHRDIVRYFMTIKEACSLVLEAGCMGKGGEVFVFDMGEQMRIYDLAEKMIRLSGKQPHVDIKIEEIGLRDGEKLYEELLAKRDNSVSTYNKKIMIAQLPRVEYDEISEQISILTQMLNNNDNMAIVAQMKLIVPEYKSNHSIYEQLDN